MAEQWGKLKAMERFQKIEKTLTHLLSLYQKYGSRLYSKDKLTEDKTTINRYLNEIRSRLRTTDPEDVLLLDSLKIVNRDINNLASQILSRIENQEKERLENQNKLTDSDSASTNNDTDNDKIDTNNTMSFDIRGAGTLVPIYDGNTDGLNAFIDAVELLESITDAAQQDTLRKFLKTRVTGKARDTLTGNITDIKQFLEDLKQHCQPTATSESVTAQLRSLKQGITKVDTYTEKVSELCRKLVQALNKETNNASISKKIAEKFALEAMIAGLSNPETSIILKAGNFGSLAEATAKAISVDEPVAKPILAIMSRNNGNQNNYDNRNGYQNNNTGNFTGGYRGGNNSYNNRNNNNYGNRNYNNFNRNFNHNNRQNNFNNNGFSRQNNNQNNANNNRNSNQNYNNRRANGNQGYQNRNDQQLNHQNRNQINYIETGEADTPQQEEPAVQLGGHQERMYTQ